MKKPVIRSPLDRIPLGQKTALVGWLTTGGADGLGLTYAEAKERLREEFGVKTSTAALCAFYSRHSRIDHPTPTPSFTYDPKANELTIIIKFSR